VKRFAYLFGGAILAVTASFAGVLEAPTASEEVQLALPGKEKPLVVRARLQAAGKPFADRWADYLRDWYAFLDRDGDGKLSAAEFGLAPSPRQVLDQWDAGLYPQLGDAGADFRLADKDHDGTVSPAEFAAYYAAAGVGPLRVVVRAADDSGRAAVSAGLFRLLDRDGDGRLSRDELRRAAESLRRLDANDDEVLTREEILPLAKKALAGTALIPSPLSVSYWVDGKLANSAVAQRLPALTNASYTFDVRLTPTGGSCRPPESASEVGEAAVATGPGAVFRLRVAPTQPYLASGIRDLYRQQFSVAAAGRGSVALATLDRTRFAALHRIGRVADRDGDGSLTEAELTRCVDLFTRSLDSHATVTVSTGKEGLFDLLDADGDGRLSPRELATAAERLLGAKPRDAAFGPDDLPLAFDVVFSQGQPDRRVVAAGPGAGATPRLAVPEWFRLMDQNGDGYVSRHEFVGSDEEFRRLDRDGDGLISPQEAIAAGRKTGK
jgi:Ca2+-binding EF-hand superfamily protein